MTGLHISEQLACLLLDVTEEWLGPTWSYFESSTEWAEQVGQVKSVSWHADCFCSSRYWCFFQTKSLVDVSLQTNFGHPFELHLKPYNSDYPNSRMPEFLFLRFHLRTRFDFDAGKLIQDPKSPNPATSFLSSCQVLYKRIGCNLSFLLVPFLSGFLWGGMASDPNTQSHRRRHRSTHRPAPDHTDLPMTGGLTRFSVSTAFPSSTTERVLCLEVSSRVNRCASLPSSSPYKGARWPWPWKPAPHAELHRFNVLAVGLVDRSCSSPHSCYCSGPCLPGQLVSIGSSLQLQAMDHLLNGHTPR